jgi:uncharacterized protein
MDDHAPRRHTDLLADIARAASIVAPQWPLTNVVAVNPLGGLQHLPFEEAAALARRWLGARTHPTLAAFRAAYDRGAITDADLRRAIVDVDWRLATRPGIEAGGTTLAAVELIRIDLLAGPDEPDRQSSDPGTQASSILPAVDELVAGWCAAFVDEAHVPWPMPHRDEGFYAAWRHLASSDRRLRRLAGRRGMRWLTDLPVRAVGGLAVALDTLGTGPEARVDALRGQLGRLPGWAGYARWHDEWAPFDHDGPAFRLVDLLAVQAAVTAAVALGNGARPSPPPAQPAPDDDLLGRRVAAVCSVLGVSSDDADVARGVREVLALVPPAARPAMWLEAHEGNVRDRLLGLLTRLDPGPTTERPQVQAVFCIDVRSEGLRRHLEACGSYETLGFAGFFGVPMRWRPMGSTAPQARCPVLVTPDHEVAERPQAADDPRRFLATRRTNRSASDAFHAAKGGLGSPFVLAEASGWLLGPLAALRTLAPDVTRQAGRWGRSLARAPRTFAAVDAAADPASGLALEERILFAEAILTTLGLRRFGRVVVLCGHASANRNNPHASAYDCGACGGAPGGASARTAAAILNDLDVRAGLAERGFDLPDDTWFVAAEHDTVSDRVTVLDRGTVPASHDTLVAGFARDVEAAGERLAQERARRLPGDPARVRARGQDWAQIRPEWGLAGNAAFVIGPRSVTQHLDLACRVFLHSYEAEADPDGVALETILTAPLVVAQWISAQYYFSTVDPDRFGAGDKLLHNPVGGVGVVLGEGGDLRVGLPLQAVTVGDRQVHEPLRLLAVVQAPLERTETIIQSNRVLRELVDGGWIRIAGRSHGDEPWSLRGSAGTWASWRPADDRFDQAVASLEVS